MITQLSLDFRTRFILSPREEQVLSGIVNGKTMQQIAHELGVNVRTVKFYAQSIREKMGANSMPSAVARAVQHGLVRCEERE